MTCCTLGARPDIESITRAMLPVDQGGEGLTVRAVAERFGIGKTRVERHWQCLKDQGYRPSPKPAAPPQRERKPESERRPKTAVETQDSGQDKTTAEPVETRQDTQDSGETMLSCPARAHSSDDTFRYRTWHLADLISAALYEGRKTNLELAKTWGCSVESVQTYARTASMMVGLDRNTLEVQREVSLAKIVAIREKALGRTETTECPHCDGSVEVAAPDYKAAVAAQRHHDEITGVLVKRSQIQLNVDPTFGQVWGCLAKMLQQKHPAAFRDCQRALDQLDAVLRKRDVIDVEPGERMLEAS